jgi:hypothetical protein
MASNDKSDNAKDQVLNSIALVSVRRRYDGSINADVDVWPRDLNELMATLTALSEGQKRAISYFNEKHGVNVTLNEIK